MKPKLIFNYKQIFEEPFVIYQITKKMTITWGIPVAKAVIFVIVALLMVATRSFWFALGNFIPGLSILLFAGVPYVISTALLKIKPNGKKLHFFLYDLMVYFFTIKLPKSRFSGDQKVLYLTEKEIRFEPCLLERKGREKDATENTDKSNS
ncbi:TPA_asm: hypothetical protein GIN74_11285 [Listeria monocytogenes]|nr:hypothetical protein [Listeria monocytogenes]